MISQSSWEVLHFNPHQAMRPTRGQDGLSSTTMTLVCYTCNSTGEQVSINPTDSSQVLAGSLFNKDADLESLLSSLKIWDQDYRNPVANRCRLISAKPAFEKWAGLPLNLCSVFELILELKRKGWQCKQYQDKGRKTKTAPKLSRSGHDVEFQHPLSQLLRHIPYPIP